MSRQIMPKDSHLTPSLHKVNQVMRSSLSEPRAQGRVLKVLGPSWTIEGRFEDLYSISKSLEGIIGDLDQSTSIQIGIEPATLGL